MMLFKQRYIPSEPRFGDQYLHCLGLIKASFERGDNS